MSKKALTVKKVHVYNILLLFGYLWIRFRIFILEDKRKITYEFTKEDILAQHYVLFIGKKASGIVRIIFAGNEAILGRFGLLNDYRNKGYGTKFIKEIISLIKEIGSVFSINLLAEDKNRGFYEKAGFLTEEILCIEGYYYNKMVIYINSTK